MTSRQATGPPFVTLLQTHRLGDPVPWASAHKEMPTLCFPRRAEIQTLTLKHKYFPSFPVQSHSLT